MGIPHLQTFQQKHVPLGYHSVGILQEIDAFKKRYHKNPILVIDVNSFMSVHARDQGTGIFGGRYQIFGSMYHKLFQRLIQAGAKLVFFIDGPLPETKLHVWLKRQDQNYLRCLKILDQIEAGKPAQKIIDSTKDVPQNRLYFVQLKAICMQYGQLYMAIYNECDLEVAAYASKHNALAVIADDSDYLIFEGNWRYWSANQLNLTHLTTMEYNRNALLTCLGLSGFQMKIFATLAGNDVIKLEDVQDFHRRLGSTKFKFCNIARFIQRQCNHITKLQSLSHEDIMRISTAIYGRCTNESIQLIINSLRSYDVMYVQTKKKRDKLLGHVIKTKKSRLYLILTNRTVNFSLFFDDLRPADALSISDIALPLVRKSMGVALQQQQNLQPVRKVGTKSSHDQPYGTVLVSPDYPPVTLPPLLEFYRTSHLQNDRYNQMRYSLLCWMIGSHRITEDVIQNIPSSYLLTILTLVYLHEHRQLSFVEADLILLATHDIVTGRVPQDLPYPGLFDGILVKKSFLFLRTISYLIDAFEIIGLEKLEKMIYFDGVYLHTLMSRNILGARLKEISHLRIYAK